MAFQEERLKKALGKNSRGQISIMISVMLMTFILMFAFVVNTGMLVNAKINLQNAADLAAYSGASVQARQLNQISFLNYEMRRQFKKFLYRVYVIGNNAQDTFPRNAGGQGQAPWQPQASASSYESPTICVIFNAQDNFCHNTQLVPITIPPPTPLDQINQTLRDQLQKLEDIRQQNCQSIGNTNYDLARLWLFNTDPKLDDLIAGVTDPLTQKRLQIIKSLAFGLGLLPREFILRNRIGTLTSYINTDPKTGLTADIADSLKNQVDPAKYERTIQAFFSAYYSLGNHSFPGDQIFLDELTPSGAESLVGIRDHKDRFDLYPLKFVPPANGQGACSVQVAPVVLPQEISLGVYKDPTIITYYAIRLRARARILFCPFCGTDPTLELSAYSAAMPFGSRIGPDPSNLENRGFTRQGQINPQPPNNLNLTQKIPNLPIFKGDSTTRGKGWDTSQVLGDMFTKLGITDNAGNIIGDINQDNLESAYQSAMVPNPFEVNFYNIPIDIGGDPFMQYFDVRNQYAFWAPIFPLDKLNQAASTISSLINEFLQGNNPAGGVGGGGAGNGADLAQALITGMNKYIGQIMDGKTLGDDDEGFRIVRLRNPFLTRPVVAGGASTLIGFASNLAVTDPKQIKTSWNEVRDSDDKAAGRVGYSVKFVSFDSLVNKRIKGNGEASMKNSLPMQNGEDLDLLGGKLKH